MMLALPDPASHAEAVARLKRIQARQAAAGRQALEQRRRQAEEAARAAAEAKAGAEAERAADEARRAIVPAFATTMEVKAIIRGIAAAHRFTHADIIGKGRQADMVGARFAAIAAVAQARPDMTLPALGRHFGNRDHTSILHALRAVHGRDYRHRAQARDDIPQPRSQP